ncbi:hypothetical protein HS125_10745 [bacterium]|nr:hypothetical protein [bacterium]
MLVTHVLFSVKNQSKEPRVAHLWLHFEPWRASTSTARPAARIGAGRRARLAAALRHPPRPRALRLPRAQKGTLSWHEEIASPVADTTPAQRVLEWEVSLAAGETAQARLVLPYGWLELPRAQALLEINPTSMQRKVETYWKRLIDGPGRITTPDPWINDYLAAVPAQMAQQVAWRHHPGLWMYKTSPNNYENYWPCNAAKALPAFTLRGLVGLDRDVLSGFIHSRTADVGGLNRARMGRGDVLAGEGFAEHPGFLGNFGGWTANPLLLSHGMGLWALARHYRITRDDAWLHHEPHSPLTTMLDGLIGSPCSGVAPCARKTAARSPLGTAARRLGPRLARGQHHL